MKVISSVGEGAESHFKVIIVSPQFEERALIAAAALGLWRAVRRAQSGDPRAGFENGGTVEMAGWTTTINRPRVGGSKGVIVDQRSSKG